MCNHVLRHSDCDDCLAQDRPYKPPKRKELPLTYAMCRICGDQPNDKFSQMNVGPIRFWDPDDGWIIGALCPWCHRDYGDRQPKETDYAYQFTNEVCDEVATDEDPLSALDL